MSASDEKRVYTDEEERGTFLKVDFDAGHEGRLKGEVRVDQSENSPTVLVSSSGWALAGECAISLEDRVA